MHINKIELIGFKSFMDLTSIELTKDITAIVGPNGCGKSNIIDALRWVMGEQSPRLLRGIAMSDVIFNGSDTRRPMGMAEVAVTFDNDNGNTPPQFKNFSEIQISRRFYRSGESEYYINKSPCRLKDIYSLFRDTGTGNRAYSIIEQGQIENLVNMKPQDRRFIIEEAAGITNYRYRRIEAHKKIEGTRQNLTRINDIISEIQHQANSLKRQAAKANRYKKLSQEIKLLEQQLLANGYVLLSGRLGEISQAADGLKVNIDSLCAEISTRENRIQEKKILLVDVEQNYHHLQEKIYKLKNSIERLENKEIGYKREIESIDAQQAKNKDQLERHKERLRRQKKQQGILEEEKERLILDVAGHFEQLNFSEEQLFFAQGETKEGQRAIEDARNEFYEVMGDISKSRNRLETLSQKRREYDERLKRLKREFGEFKEKEADVDSRIQRLADQKGKLEDRLQEQKTLLDEKNRELAVLEDEMEQATASLHDYKEKYREAASMLKSLRSLDENFSYYNEAVKSVMSRAEAGQSGVLSLVANLVETPREYEAAVEAVLGERLQAVVVRDLEAGVNAIEYLKAEAGGRGSFIPVKLNSRNGSVLPDKMPDGVITPLIDVVKLNDDFDGLKDYLFGDVMVVRDLETAAGIWNRDCPKATLVTLDGEVLDYSGAVTGGKYGRERKSILGQKRRMKELSADVERLEAKIGRQEKELASITGRMVNIEEFISEVESGINSIKIEILSNSKDTEAIKNEKERIAKGLRAGELEIGQLKELDGEIQKELSEVRKTIESKNEAKDVLDNEIARMKEQMERADQFFTSANDQRTQAEIALRTAEEKLRNWGINYEQIQNTIQETQDQAEHFKAEMIFSSQRSEALSREIEDCKDRAEDLIKKEIKLQDDLLFAKEEYDAKASEIKSSEENLGILNRQMKELQDQLNREELKISQVAYERNRLAEDSRVKFGSSIDTFVAEVDLTDFEEEKARDDLHGLSEKREAMGSVNLIAIEQYEELSSRLEFLSTQRQDLEESILSLEKLIHKINRTSRKRFKEAFDKINEKFQEIFPKLFSGGKAMLELTDENDLLDTGVDIKVQPPGKNLRNMQLLSGGEKALASVSLIFAVFMIKPSPFCILDEVDAPLDDSNIEKFNSVVKEISSMSQMILITHNKKTMQVADTLFGVTMEDPGVSKLLSVKIRDLDEESRIVAPRDSGNGGAAAQIQ